MRENLLSHIDQLLKTQLPFFILRKKDSMQVQLLHQKNKCLHKKAHDKIACAVFTKFQRVDNQVFIHGEVNKKFDWQLKPINSKEATVNLTSHQKSKHQNMVKAAIAVLQKAELRKVVLSLSTSVSKTLTDLDIWSNLLDAYPTANCYFFYHPQVGKWMGATPETLLSYNQGTVKTMSLAGTIKSANEEEINWGEKEKEEQQIVTDYILKSLESITKTKVITGPRHNLRAGSVFHLNTMLQVETRFEKVEQIAQALHPTPAVCGLPRALAYQYIEKHEGYDRSYYTGYLGIEDAVSQQTDLFVNLRCMQINQEDIVLYAGGGITASSNPAAEVVEIQNKLSTMASIL